MRTLLRLFRALGAFLVALTLALGGCKKDGGSSATSETKLTVECIGMSKKEPLAGYYAFMSMDMQRCQMLVSDTVYDPANVELLEQGGGNWGKPNTATLVINFAGKTWVGRSGKIKFDSYDENQATGTYELVGVETSTGEEATLTGPIGFCDYGANPKCPHQTSGIAALSKRLGFSTPDSFDTDEATTRANDCRVLIDKSKSAVRVDIQMAVLNGVNIARFRDRCGSAVPVSAGFRFWAVGVKGPGTYGPTTAKPVVVGTPEPAFLPDFHLEVPTVYWLGNCSSNPDRVFDVHPTASTSCSFTIADDPGRFQISCTDAVHTEPSYSRAGKLELSADCDVRTVN